MTIFRRLRTHASLRSTEHNRIARLHLTFWGRLGLRRIRPRSSLAVIPKRSSAANSHNRSIRVPIEGLWRDHVYTVAAIFTSMSDALLQLDGLI
jgi:hypothetical protein